MIVDLFAGGGGASTGIKLALGREVDIAINHDPEAVSVHTKNHPGATHFCSDVFEVDPMAATQGRPVGLLWASPDCKHFSKAKGGKPVDKRIRSLAWVVIKWARSVRPRVICLENVEEFQTWGPLGADNKPCPQRKGQTFSIWIEQLRQLGYTVEHKELRACDFGAPTTRKRLFVVARCDGQPIVWPKPTHAKPNADGLAPDSLKPWRTAAECIDFTLPCPSIFERKKPLADATCRRIAKGIVRYVLENPKPFIVQYYSAKRDGDDRTADLDAPLPTQTTENRFALATVKVIPAIVVNTTGHPGSGVVDPLRTIATGGHHALVTAFLAKHYTGVVGSELEQPVGTVTSIDHHSLVTANLVHMGHGEGKAGGKRFSHGVRDIEEPLNTVTASGVPAGLVTSHLVKLRNNQFGQDVEQPVPTLTAGGGHVGEIRAFLVKYYGTAIGTDLNDPVHTVTSKARMGLVTVTIAGEEYVIADIGLRMLTPAELYKAQGFPDDYIFETGAHGERITKTAQVRMVGNSVCPPVAKSLIECNYVPNEVAADVREVVA
ncbi:DNA cytosine methyltransferase [Methylomonas sp. EFPC1]|uniref:DNA cytosine methyltransferase n=1 Tax=Methylomonas sp. EFPC1 TaxID=2812647 RepID=UPI0031F84626